MSDDDDDDMGPSGTLVIDPENNPLAKPPAPKPSPAETPADEDWDIPDDDPATLLTHVPAPPPKPSGPPVDEGPIVAQAEGRKWSKLAVASTMKLPAPPPVAALDPQPAMPIDVPNPAASLEPQSTMQIDVPSANAPLEPKPTMQMDVPPPNLAPLEPMPTVQMDLPEAAPIKPTLEMEAPLPDKSSLDFALMGTMMLPAQPDRPPQPAPLAEDTSALPHMMQPQPQLMQAEPHMMQAEPQMMQAEPSWNQPVPPMDARMSPPAPPLQSFHSITPTQPSSSSKFIPIALAIIVAGAVASVGFWIAFGRGSTTSTAGSASAVAPPPETATALPIPASATASAAPALPEADQKARAALERFRGGVRSCILDTLHRLPGTSKPVPNGMVWLKAGPYPSLRRDWASAVFTCSHFKMEEPMPFLIQWQADERDHKGTGVVWVDGNADGVADTAYAFVLTMKPGSKDVTLGEIETIDVSREIRHVN